MTQSVALFEPLDVWPESAPTEALPRGPSVRRIKASVRLPAATKQSIAEPDLTPAITVEPIASQPDWRLLVAAEFRHKFAALSEELFVALADRAPGTLARLLTTEGVLDNAELTLAAEAMGRVENSTQVRVVLLPLLEHPSAVVREGAMYGVAGLDSPDVRMAIEILARKDKHPGVRRAAEAVLSGKAK